MINIEEFTFLSSDGQTRLHAMLWLPEGEIRGILQIAHGVAEHVARYDGFARYLCARGIAVAGTTTSATANPSPLAPRPSISARRTAGSTPSTTSTRSTSGCRRSFRTCRFALWDTAWGRF